MTKLTVTETKMLQDAADGYTTAESAQRHWKAIETVKTQRKQILKKLEANNITHAAAIGIRSEVIE